MRYDNLNGALSRDSILEQQWPWSTSRDCGGLSRHNLLNTCWNGASEVSIGIYVNKDAARIVIYEHKCGSYGVLNLLGDFSPNNYGKMFTWSQVLVERQKVS